MRLAWSEPALADIESIREVILAVARAARDWKQKEAKPWEAT